MVIGRQSDANAALFEHFAHCGLRERFVFGGLAFGERQQPRFAPADRQDVAGVAVQDHAGTADLLAHFMFYPDKCSMYFSSTTENRLAASQLRQRPTEQSVAD